jgi:hypothetical protein
MLDLLVLWRDDQRREVDALSSSSSGDGVRPLHDLCADGVLQPRHLAVAVRADAHLDDEMRRPLRDERRDAGGGEPRETMEGPPIVPRRSGARTRTAVANRLA